MNNQKFGLNYRVSIQNKLAGQASLAITMPFTMEFDITRDTSSSVNQGTFKIYNLSEQNQADLFKDRYSIQDNGTQVGYRQIIVEAGYNEDLSTIFQGNILECSSARQGNDVITSITAQDGGYAVVNAFVSTTLQKGLNTDQIANELINQVSASGKIEKGAITTFPDSATSKRGTVFNGNGWALLQDQFGRDYEVYIDLEKINITGLNECIKAEIPLITSETGLLGCPVRESSNLKVEIIFDPRIQVGSLVEVKSDINKLFNGQYKVSGVKHSGTISATMGGQCKTILSCFVGSFLFGNLKQI